MSNTELILAVSVIAVLLLIPLGVLFAVRILIPLEEAVVGDGDEGLLAEFTSLRDFWESNVPHLTELRDRLIKALLAVAIGTGIGFALVSYTGIIDIILNQFVPADIRPQSTGVAENFVGFMRVALVIGVAISVPVVLYQIVAFLAPALHASEKRVLYTALPFVFELFLAGVAFGWFFTIPAAMGFLIGFNPSERVAVQPTLTSILETVSTLLLWNGVVFELPALVYLVARIGLVSREMLARTRRYAVVVIVIIAAIITPTGDPYNLLLLAVPMYLLYEMGIFLTRFVPKRETGLETVQQN